METSPLNCVPRRRRSRFPTPRTPPWRVPWTTPSSGIRTFVVLAAQDFCSKGFYFKRVLSNKNWGFTICKGFLQRVLSNQNLFLAAESLCRAHIWSRFPWIVQFVKPDMQKAWVIGHARGWLTAYYWFRFIEGWLRLCESEPGQQHTGHGGVVPHPWNFLLPCLVL